MAADDDRLKGSVAALGKGADPMLFYRCLYRATLVVQSPDLERVDVLPDDPLLPPLSDIPLHTGAGQKVRLAPGTTLSVTWDDGRPDRPIAIATNASTALELTVSVTGKATIDAPLVNLGGDNLVPLVDSVLRGATLCPILNVPHSSFGEASLVVLAKKAPT